MGPQGKRWPKWKQRRDNSGDDITEENRQKKLHHGVKCIRKALKKARTFEEQKIKRRTAQATAAAKSGGKKPAVVASAASLDADKLAQQLAAVKALDIEALGSYMGRATYDAVLASRDAPTAEKALPTADATETATAETAVGPKAIEAAGVQQALVVARRVLATASVRTEVSALQEKLVLVGDRQDWAKGRLEREELRRLAKEEYAAAKEKAKEEAETAKQEEKDRTKHVGPGAVDDGEVDGEDGGSGEGESGDEEDDWSSGGEDEGRPDLSDSDGEDSNSDDIVIRDDDGELERFLAEEEAANEGESDESDDDEDEGSEESESDPDEELPPELAKILGVEQKGKKAGKAKDDKKGTKKQAEPPAKKKPKKRMGQRARRAIAEAKFGQHANHIKAERDEQMRRERQSREQEEMAQMHPAWAAKRAAAAALAAAPKGTKVSFGDDGDTVGVQKPARKSEGARVRNDRDDKKSSTPSKPKTPKPPKVYAEIKGGTGEVVGKVTKPMGPSGAKKDDDKSAKKPRGGDDGYNPDAAESHPAWAAKRKAAEQAMAKPAGKKIKFGDD
jgi:hypothetical protein